MVYSRYENLPIPPLPPGWPVPKPPNPIPPGEWPVPMPPGWPVPKPPNPIPNPLPKPIPPGEWPIPMPPGWPPKPVPSGESPQCFVCYSQKCGTDIPIEKARNMYDNDKPVYTSYTGWIIFIAIIGLVIFFLVRKKKIY
jgi:hypothetical protein